MDITTALDKPDALFFSVIAKLLIYNFNIDNKKYTLSSKSGSCDTED